MNRFDSEGPELTFWKHREAQGTLVPVLPSGPGAYFFERVEYMPVKEPSPEEQERYVRAYFEMDDETGRFLLGDCYRHGRGVPQSYDKAIWWFLRSAEDSKNQRRRLQACFAFYKAAPWDLERAYSVEKGRSKVFKPYTGLEMWRTLTPRELAEGLRRLTEFELKNNTRHLQGNE